MGILDDFLQLSHLLSSIVAYNLATNSSVIDSTARGWNGAICTLHTASRSGLPRSTSTLARPPNLKLLLSFEESRINFQNVLIEVFALQSCDCNVQISVDDGYFVALIHAEVESLNVVVVREYTLNLSLYEYIGYERGQMIRSDLLVLVQSVGLCQDFDRFLKLL